MIHLALSYSKFTSQLSVRCAGLELLNYYEKFKLLSNLMLEESNRSLNYGLLFQVVGEFSIGFGI